MREVQMTCKMKVFMLLTCVLITAHCDVIAQDNDEPISTSQTMSIDLAYERALQYTGLAQGFRDKDRMTELVLSSATLSTGRDSTMPYFSDSIQGQPVWHLVFDSVYLNYDSRKPEVVAKHNPKSFHVVLHATTGALLKIYTVFAGVDSNLAPEPPADSVTAFLRANHDVYVSLVHTPPTIPFYQALEKAYASSPLTAKELVVWLVTQRIGSDTTPRPVWLVLGRGVQPFELHPRPDLPMYMRNRVLSAVDATTGEPLYAVTPPPILSGYRPRSSER